jgi:hypothetical protein
MPKKPYKYIISLTETQRAELQQLVRSGKTERRIADRARIVLWADEGLTIAKTQHRLGCSEQIVINWRRDFLERRDSESIVSALSDRPRSGRRPGFSPSATSDG